MVRILPYLYFLHRVRTLISAGLTIARFFLLARSMYDSFLRAARSPFLLILARSPLLRADCISHSFAPRAAHSCAEPVSHILALPRAAHSCGQSVTARTLARRAQLINARILYCRFCAPRTGHFCAQTVIPIPA